MPAMNSSGLSSTGWRALLARLAGMSLDEWKTRTYQETSKRLDALRAALRMPPQPRLLAADPAVQPRFFFDPLSLRSLADAVAVRFPETAGRVCSEAEEILAGRFRVLGYGPVDWGFPPDWHRDPLSGHRAPHTAWYRIRFLEPNRVGDHKVVWELNRHQHLVTLAKAWLLSGEERFAADVVRLWYDWQEKNAYPLGINWASSLEVAFRTLSWLWLRHLLQGCPALPAKFREDLTLALGRSGRHIARYLSTYFAPNTHLLGEGVALFFIGLLCPELAMARAWRQQGWEIVLQEAGRQVRADGMHFEQSTYYHVYALDFFLHARILAGRNGITVPEDFDRTIQSMLEALARLSQAGCVPRFGDDDGGRVFDGNRNRTEHLTDPLVIGAALYGRSDWKAVRPEPGEEALWLLGEEGLERFDALAARPAPGSFGLTQSGIYGMASTEPPARMLAMDCGPHGMGRGGHGHADALSVQLIRRGRIWIDDPGTCSYSEPGLRDLYRGTSAHSTLVVDGQDLAQPSGPFAWTQPVDARMECWITAPAFDFLKASHAGYSRLPGAVVHHRSVFYLRNHYWLVLDEARGEGEHQLDVHWRLHPNLELLSVGSEMVFTDHGAGGGLAFIPESGAGWSSATGLGERSPAYGQRETAPVVCFSRAARLPASFATLLVPFEEQPPSLRLQRVSAAGDPSVHAYEIRAGHDLHRIFFGEPGRVWNCGGWSSDSGVIYCRSAASGQAEAFCMGAGSQASFQSQPVILLGSRCDYVEWLSENGRPPAVFPPGSTEMVWSPDALPTRLG